MGDKNMAYKVVALKGNMKGRYAISDGFRQLPFPSTKNKNKAVGLKNKLNKLARLRKQVRKLDWEIKNWRG